MADIDSRIARQQASESSSRVEIVPGFWERAGRLRARVLARNRKARLGDALIAQSCIDAGVFLITRDRDFRAFVDAAGLNLMIG